MTQYEQKLNKMVRKGTIILIIICAFIIVHGQGNIEHGEIKQVVYVSESYFTPSSPSKYLIELVFRLNTNELPNCYNKFNDEVFLEKIRQVYNLYYSIGLKSTLDSLDYYGFRGLVIIELQDGSTRYIAIPGAWSNLLSINGLVIINDNRLLRLLKKNSKGHCKEEIKRLMKKM